MGLRKPKFLELTIVWIYAAFFGIAVSVSILVRAFKKGFKQTFSWKQITERPACMDDPSLGTHGFLHLENVKIHYVASGPEDKPLMLFLHGFPEFWYSWRYQLREFQKDYRVVAIDLRGYGESDKPSGVDAYVMTKLQEDVRQVIVALGYKSCILVAHDWGGAIAWCFARFFSDFVDRLIIMNGPPGGIYRKVVRESSKQRKMSWYISFFQIPFLPELSLKLGNFKAFEQLLKKSNGENNKDDIQAYKYTFSQPGALTPPINYYRALIRVGSLPYDMDYVMPVLLIWGVDDTALCEEIADSAGKANPDKITVKKIPGANHYVTFDAPEIVNATMREWLKEHA